MAQQLFSNYARTNLATTVSEIATSLMVSDSSSFPAVESGFSYFLATLVEIDADGNERAWEIVRVTKTIGNVWTVVRGQESTFARTWLAGTRVGLRLTADTADDFITRAEFLEILGDAIPAHNESERAHPDIQALVSSVPPPPPGAQVFTSNGTFTVPARVKSIKVTIYAGGGGGGGGSGGCTTIANQANPDGGFGAAGANGSASSFGTHSVAGSTGGAGGPNVAMSNAPSLSVGANGSSGRPGFSRVINGITYTGGMGGGGGPGGDGGGDPTYGHPIARGGTGGYADGAAIKTLTVTPGEQFSVVVGNGGAGGAGGAAGTMYPAGFTQKTPIQMTSTRSAKPGGAGGGGSKGIVIVEW